MNGHIGSGCVRASRFRRQAFAFLYSLGVLAVVGAFIMAGTGFAVDPAEVQRRAILDDLSFDAALSGVNYARDYINTIAAWAQLPRGCTGPGNSPFYIMYQMEPWCGGPAVWPDPSNDCLTRVPSTLTSFPLGSVCFYPTDVEKTRLSFTLQLTSTNLENNYYFWGMNAGTCPCVPSGYTDMPDYILYRIEATGMVQVHDSTNPLNWVQVAQRQIFWTFTFWNDQKQQNAPPPTYPCNANYWFPVMDSRFVEVTR